MANYGLTNNLSALPLHSTSTYDSELIIVDNNAGRPITARASYITNLNDLSVTLAAGNLDIGSFHIEDPDSGLKVNVLGAGVAQGGLVSLIADTTTGQLANVIDIGNGQGALRVLSQDLESSVDDITIGDRNGNFAHVTNSALNVFTTNGISAVSVTNFPTQLTAVSITNQLTGLTVLNSITAVQVLNPVSAFSLTNQITSISVTNFPTQLTAVSITNQLTSTSVTVLNPVSSFTLLNSSIEISNNVGNPVPVTITSPVSNILINPALPITYADSIQIDQAGRLRVAVPRNSWWYVASVDKDGDVRYQESFTTGASSIWIQNLASVFLTSGTQSPSASVIRASRRRHKVVPGQSHEWHGTFNFDGKQNNVIKRTGMYTAFNGYFFELSGTDMNVVVRRRMPDGSPVEERVEQRDWNGDKLDGTGPSLENWSALTQSVNLTGWVSTTPISIGLTTIYNVVYTSSTSVSGLRLGTKGTVSGVSPTAYNGVATIVGADTTTNRITATYLTPVNGTATFSNAQFYQTGWHMAHTFWFDFMGGRTNRVRFGKISDYGPIVLHTFRFDGLLGTAYENAPALMERKEVTNFGIPSGIPSFTDMGNAFTIEAETDISPNFCLARNDAGVVFTTAGNEYPILGLAIRNGEPYQRADIQVQNLHIVDTLNIDNNNNLAALSWRLVLNPAIQGVIPTSTNTGKASRQWAYTTANSVSGGLDLLGGYIVSKSTEDLATSLNFLNMGSNIEYTDSDKVVLVVKLLNKGTSDSNIVATMNFVEAL